ncbi:hypothetical protein NDS46_30600 (plasmid) [Paenibacillus thiaminolyticus]|uniref:hypothetical protein n=1 Tax=Paenibacillus thiaminolyticus TaxID=49283 RepID=UPI0023312D8A|nr:hypothetical protein [Paenibacillus thiaminolyticus]WCF11700.1 hypothetical protein NDS46_30600 [Paenibacillus thiaminolyticus]
MYTNVRRLSDGRIEIRADVYELINEVAWQAAKIENAEKRVIQFYVQDGTFRIQLEGE